MCIRDSLTDAGLALKETVEAATDASVHASWSHIDDAKLTEVAKDAKTIAELVGAAGLIPQKLFGRD